MKSSTSKKILDAAITLFSKEGYKGTTTSAIAEAAGVSEMTIFRNFKSKQNLFEKSLNEYIFEPKIQSLFDNGLNGNVKTDLKAISQNYLEVLRRNKKSILMFLKNDHLALEFDLSNFKFPNHLKKLLTEYFSYQIQINRIINKNPEILALNFLSANFGFFITFEVFEHIDTNFCVGTCCESYIETFADGLTKNQEKFINS